MTVEELFDFAHLDFSDKDPAEVQVFHDGFARQAKGFVDMFRCLKQAYDCIVVYMFEFDLVFGKTAAFEELLHRVGPFQAVVAQNGPNMGDAPVANQRADFLNTHFQRQVGGENGIRVENAADRLDDFLHPGLRELESPKSFRLYFPWNKVTGNSPSSTSPI